MKLVPFPCFFSNNGHCLLYCIMLTLLFLSSESPEKITVNLCLPCFYQLVYLAACSMLLVHGGQTRPGLRVSMVDVNKL